MTFFSGLLIYVVLWWILFLMILPCAVTVNSITVVGHDPGAPAQPFLGCKVLITTGLTTLILILLVPLYPHIEALLQNFIDQYTLSYSGS